MLSKKFESETHAVRFGNSGDFVKRRNGLIDYVFSTRVRRQAAGYDNYIGAIDLGGDAANFFAFRTQPSATLIVSESYVLDGIDAVRLNGILMEHPLEI